MLQDQAQADDDGGGMLPSLSPPRQLSVVPMEGGSGRLDDGAGERFVEGDDDDEDTMVDSRHTRSNDDQDDEEDDLLFLAESSKEQNVAVGKTRLIVFMFLLVCIIGVAVGVYFGTRHSETQRFKQKFRDDAKKVLMSIGTSLDLTLAGFDALAVSMVSHVRATNQSWPLIDIPDFGARAAIFRDLTNAAYMTMYPYIQDHEERMAWEAWNLPVGKAWVETTLELQERSGVFQEPLLANNITAESVTYFSVIHDYDQNFNGEVGIPHEDAGPFMPMWHTYPLLPYTTPYNWNLMALVDRTPVDYVLESHKVSLSEVYMASDPNDKERIREDGRYASWIKPYLNPGEPAWEPLSNIYYPILKDAADYVGLRDEDYIPTEENLAGILVAAVYWRNLMKGILSEDSVGVTVVMDNGCTPAFTYQIDGQSTTYLGTGDQHDPQFDELMESGFLIDLSREFTLRQSSSYTGAPVNEEFCPFYVTVYPTVTTEQASRTHLPALFAGLAALIFILTSLCFIAHDCVIEHRQEVLMRSALQTDRMISSYFPASVRGRLLASKTSSRGQNDVDSPAPRTAAGAAAGEGSVAPKTRSYYSLARRVTTGIARKNVSVSMDTEGAQQARESGHIADSYPNTTILFADIAGFTAWSSTREPAQVFLLLETLYASFDHHAKKFSVFKVETVGDCYVAATGLPLARRNHAVVMVRFCSECLRSMVLLVRELELKLGPDTAKLQLRCGLHSGATVGGVLRGEKSRFQIFGDTVNTAARMESHGAPGKIHASGRTAAELVNSGKAFWITERDDMIEAKGKGSMRTFWIDPARPQSATTDSQGSAGTALHSAKPVTTGSIDLEIDDGHSYHLRVYGDAVCGIGTPKCQSGDPSSRCQSAESKERMIAWVCSLLEERLAALESRRRAATGQPGASHAAPYRVEYDQWRGQRQAAGESAWRGEVSDSIPGEDWRRLSEPFGRAGSGRITHHLCDESPVSWLPIEVVQELRSCVSQIANSYNHENCFHNWDHSVQVATSTCKLIERIAGNENAREAATEVGETSSSGLAGDEQFPFAQRAAQFVSEPLVQLAAIFAALIHDSGHLALTNPQWIAADPAMTKFYERKSVSEQHSLEVGWDIIMHPAYSNLHACMFAERRDLELFRQLVTNAVIATDIFDPNLRKRREERWKRSFGDSQLSGDDENHPEKMAIILECLIQASDLSHTMQHWMIFQDWNTRLYEEMWTSYASGRACGKDPSETWYQSELYFFENQVMPLAQKLMECQVFGKAIHELYDAACENRLEWEIKGQDIVKKRKERVSSVNVVAGSDQNKQPSLSSTSSFCSSNSITHDV